MEEAPKFYVDRLEKTKAFRDLGINPYPYSFNQTAHATDILTKYDQLVHGEESPEAYSVAGRIMLLRRIGKVTFMTIQDASGKIQIYLTKNDLPTYDNLKLFDIGDFIGVQGKVFRTKMGEITINASKFEMLCKALQQLPEKYHGLQDTELRYRMRYVDLIVNPEVREVFKKRSIIIAAIREFLDEKGFVEVETPTLQPMYGGANARPFVTHINAWDMKLYLSISPELYLKRLIVGGFEKVYTICKNFRNEGVDRSHNPEFTMTECYWAYADYNDVMSLTENLYAHVCKKVNDTTKITYQGTELDFTVPWKRMTMKQAVKELGGIDVDELPEDELFNLRRTYNINVEGDLTRGKMIQLLFEELCEAKIIQPTFIIDHPKESTPLCKVHRNDPELIERFEPFCCGMELANAYSELNDPVLQKTLLLAQAEELRTGSEESHPMDEDFVKAIEYGMPPTGGLGFGVDRMVLLFTDQPSIRDVILFPTMRPENKSDK